MFSFVVLPPPPPPFAASVVLSSRIVLCRTFYLCTLLCRTFYLYALLQLYLILVCADSIVLPFYYNALLCLRALYFFFLTVKIRTRGHLSCVRVYVFKYDCHIFIDSLLV